jgi:hypothetical protein
VSVTVIVAPGAAAGGAVTLATIRSGGRSSLVMVTLALAGVFTS